LAPGLGIIVNPHASRNRPKPDRVEELKRIVGDQGTVREAASVNELFGVVRELRDGGVDVVGVCGGDGSLFRVFSAVSAIYDGRSLPAILPLPAGTMNTVARALGCISGSPERILGRFLEQRRTGAQRETILQPLLRVNEAYAGCTVGVGAIVSFLDLYYGQRRRGPIGAAALLSLLIASALLRRGSASRLFKPFPAVLRCNGQALPFSSFSLIYASTIEEIGLGFRPTNRARERSGWFHVLAGPVQAAELVRLLGRLFRGVPTRSSRLHDDIARELTAELEQPTRFMIDGDILEAVSHLKVESGPVLTVIRR
jgi:diacylglycerol kinase family enzyme